MDPRGADAIGPEDEAVARVALTALVFAQEAELLKKTLPQFDGLRLPPPSSSTFLPPSFGLASAVDAGIGVSGLPPDRLPTTVLFPSSAGAPPDGDETDTQRQQRRMHRQNLILQRAFTGKK